MRFRTHNDVTLRLWHDFFVVWPRKVGNTWVAFETIRRKGILHTRRHVDPQGYVSFSHYMEWEYLFPELKGGHRKC